jgi:hypothetical protein
MSKTSRTTAIAVVIGVAAIGAYWYWSPLIAMNSMKSAAEERDADVFNQYVDYPSVRESLKGQFNARLMGALGESSRGSQMEQGAAAFGAMLGAALVGSAIDAMVRPEVVMRAMSEGRLQNPMETGEGGSGANAEQDRVEWTLERKGVDRVLAFGRSEAEEDPAARVAFVFDRQGFAGWKLTEIRLPAEQ